VVGVLLFANQVAFQGYVAKAVPQVGDIAFFVGFLTAAVVYAALFAVQRGREPQDAVLVTPDEEPSGSGEVSPVG
jgi:cytosine/uracil/thiamine/allantoin permease